MGTNLGRLRLVNKSRICNPHTIKVNDASYISIENSPNSAPYNLQLIFNKLRINKTIIDCITTYV